MRCHDVLRTISAVKKTEKSSFENLVIDGDPVIDNPAPK